MDHYHQKPVGFKSNTGVWRIVPSNLSYYFSTENDQAHKYRRAQITLLSNCRENILYCG